MKRISSFVCLLTILLFACIFSVNAQNAASSWTVKPGTSRVFIENKGQFPVSYKSKIKSVDVLYAYDGKNTMIYFTPKGVVYCLKKTAEKKEDNEKKLNKRGVNAKTWEEKEAKERKTFYEDDIINFTWENANADVTVTAEDVAPDYFSYCFYNSRDSLVNVNNIKAYKKITYTNLYPNIDVVYEFHPTDGIKYSLILHPGADISQVKMNYSSDVKIKSNGDLQIKGMFGNIIDHAPVSFYAGSKASVISSSFSKSQSIISFKLDAYDKTKTVIVDPWVQTPALSNSNCVWECERDASGNVYVIGGDMPLKLQKYTATGAIQWTYVTPWDTSGEWLGTLATDLLGNSYVTNGSTAALQRVNTNAGLDYSVTGGALDEYWKIAFNCDQTKLVIGGTRLSMLPPANSYGMIFDIDAATGSVLGTQIVGWERPNGIMSDIDEVRSISSCRNARYYYMTLDSLGTIDQNIGLCPNALSLLKLPHTYNFGYKCENFRPNNGNAGINCIRANRYFVYTQNGSVIEKRSLSTGAVINSAPIPGGSTVTVSLFTPTEYQMGNDGIDIDTCGNVYVGSCGSVVKFDANLNLITSVTVPFNVYDVAVSTGGNIIVCGGTGTNSNVSRTGYVQSINMSACNPMSLYCCNANICPVTSMCSTDAAITLTPSTPGGTWSGVGITDAVNGVFDPAVAGPGQHTIVYTLACGSDSTVISVTSCANLAVCVEQNGDLTVSAGTPPYTWDSGTNWTDCSGCTFGMCIPGICNGVIQTTWTNIGTGTTFTVPAGNDTIRVTDVYGNSLIIYNISSLPPCPPCPSLFVTNNSTDVACNGQATGTITAQSGGVGPMDFVLTDGLGNILGNFTNVTGPQHFNNLPAGTYNLTVTDTALCDTVITIVINQPLGITQAYTIVDEVCQGSCTGSIGLAVSGGSGPFTYHWSNGASTQNLTNICYGPYSVTITDANNCTFDTTVNVNYLIAASIAANPATGAPPLDVNFTYTGTPGISYVWDFGDGSPTDATQNPSHTYAVAGNYNVVMTVSINNTQSCTLTLIVVVENPSHLIIPNVFTPNGDGHNDIFMMDYMSIQSFSCLIFNRWGKKVYEWSDPATGWDGKLTSGGKAADGVYYYVIKAKGTDGVDYNEHGTVTLVRH